MTRSIIKVVGQERGRQWTNRDAKNLSSERRQNREGESLDPKTMPTSITR